METNKAQIQYQKMEGQVTLVAITLTLLLTSAISLFIKRQKILQESIQKRAYVYGCAKKYKTALSKHIKETTRYNRVIKLVKIPALLFKLIPSLQLAGMSGEQIKNWAKKLQRVSFAKYKGRVWKLIASGCLPLKARSLFPYKTIGPRKLMRGTSEQVLINHKKNKIQIRRLDQKVTIQWQNRETKGPVYQISERRVPVRRF